MRLGLAGLVLACCPLLAAFAAAEPLDLRDPTPRWVEVAFEVSPRDRPAQTDTVYTRRIPAWLAPGAEPGQVVITIDRSYVEGVLFANDEPVSGSFSDYVWVFDAHTGEVVSATVSGTLTQRLDWGFFHTRARTQVAAEMTTRHIAGIEQPRHWLGQQLFSYCDDAGDEACDLVAGHPYDPASGYVYAVGPLAVQVSDVMVETYSPLGEAIFSEREGSAIVRTAEGGDEADLGGPRTAVRSLAAPKLLSSPAVSASPPGER